MTTIAATTRPTAPRTLLRRVLGLDAVVTGANGIAYLLASGPLAELFGMSAGLLLGVGVFLAVYGIAVGLLARRPVPSVPLTRLVIEGNVLWVIASIAGLALWLDAGPIGVAWTIAQAAVVLGFACAQQYLVGRMRAA